MEAQTFIETTLQFKELHIKQTIPYATIYHSLEKQCDATAITEAQTLAEIVKQSRTSNIRPVLLEKEMERRFTLLKNLISSLKTNDEKLYCKQKYLTYALLEYTQGLYLGTASVSTTPPKTLAPATTPSPSTPLLQPPITQVLEPTIGHWSAETVEQIQYLTLMNTQTWTEKLAVAIAQVAENYIQKEIGKLISLGFLTPSDLEILNEKIELNYVAGCGTTRGSYHMTQRTDGTNKKFKQIKLNINLCGEQYYLENFENYVRQIFVHELGHYFYYFKDSQSSKFGNFCWKSGENACENGDFVSGYAMKNKEEDYAESFTHRYLGTTTQNAMIVSHEHSSAEASSGIKQAKEQYFISTYSSLWIGV